MNISDVTAPNVTTALIENGARRQWSAAHHADLIRMFASHGFDVLTGGKDANGDFTVNPNAPGFKEYPHSREVAQDGHRIAAIIWHPAVPGCAFATTYRTSNDIRV
jgi:hypothetical protein